MKKREVSFQVQDLLPIGISVVVLGIALAYGLSVTSDIAVDINETGTSNEAYLAASDTITAISNITGKIPTIVTIVVAAVIIGILVVYLANRFQ